MTATTFLGRPVAGWLLVAIVEVMLLYWVYLLVQLVRAQQKVDFYDYYASLPDEKQ